MTGCWTDRIYLSEDDNLDSSDRLLRNAPLPFDGLQAGEQTITSASVALPVDASLAPGAYRLIVALDSGGQIAESNEVNNSAASGVIQLDFPDLPDLVVSDIQSPLQAQSGQFAFVTFTVSNQGEGDFFGEFDLAVIPPVIYTFGCMFTGTLLARLWAEFGAQEESEDEANHKP